MTPDQRTVLRAKIEAISAAKLDPETTADAILAAVERLLPNGEAPAVKEGPPETVGADYLIENLKLKKTAVYDAIARDKIPGRLDLGSATVRFSRAQVDAWLEGRAEEPKPSNAQKRRRQ